MSGSWSLAVAGMLLVIVLLLQFLLIFFQCCPHSRICVCHHRYIPAIFGVVLLAGVGVLTSSLGDVMDEGTFGLVVV